jgi:hypothetical protein
MMPRDENIFVFETDEFFIIIKVERHILRHVGIDDFGLIKLLQ